MNIAARLFTWFRGRQVGEDAGGNRYFIEREPRSPGARPRRWVLYAAAAASPVPDGWQAWLRYGGAGSFAERPAWPATEDKR